MRGITLQPIILQTEVDGEEATVVIPRNSQVEVKSSDDWYHDCSEADIQEAAQLLKDHDGIKGRGFYADR